MQCPYCKGELALVKTGKPKAATYGGNQTMRQTAPTPNLAGISIANGATGEHERQEYRAPSIAEDVTVPLVKALVTGTLVGLPTMAGMITLGFDQASAIYGGGIMLLTATAGTWLLKQGWQDDLVWLVETVTHRDIDGDGVEGKPEPETVRLEVVSDPNPGKFTGLNIDLPDGVDRGLFAHWAVMVVNGTPTGREHWTGKGKPFGRQLYDNFLQALDTAGIIRDSGDGRGRVLTTGGRHSLKRFLRTSEGE